MMLLLREPIRSGNCDGLLRVSLTRPQTIASIAGDA